MKKARRCSQKNTIFAEDGVAVVVANIVHLNQNTQRGLQMLKLQNEIDPRLVQPKHLANKNILVREKDEIYISKVIMIADTVYVRYFSVSKPITEVDGWAQLPISTYL